MLSEQQRAFARVLDLVEEAGCMPFVALIGSWAEYVYEEAGILPGFGPNIRTLDVDFLIRNLRRPVPAVGLAVLARDRGFFVESDRLNGSTRILDASGLEVEFLIRKMGAGAEVSLKTNVGVTAQTLRHLEILSANLIEVICLGHLLRVPAPEAYVIHKMVINNDRGPKAEKDALAITGLVPYLNEERAVAIFQSLSKKEQARVRSYIAKHDIGHR